MGSGAEGRWTQAMLKKFLNWKQSQNQTRNSKLRRQRWWAWGGKKGTNHRGIERKVKTKSRGQLHSYTSSLMDFPTLLRAILVTRCIFGPRRHRIPAWSVSSGLLCFRETKTKWRCGGHERPTVCLELSFEFLLGKLPGVVAGLP